MTQNTVQSTYNRYAPIAQAGMPADMSSGDADTLVCESAAIGFGLAVSHGSADNGGILGGTNFRGVAIRDVTLVHDTADQYETGDNMGVAVRGDIWIKVVNAVTPGLQAYYNTSTGRIGKTGAGTAIAGAVFLDSADAEGFSRLRLSSAIGDITT
jgi:hypothetical protein